MLDNKEIETSIKDIQKIVKELDCRKNVNLDDIKQEIKTLNETINISLREIKETLAEIQENQQKQKNSEKNDRKCLNEFKSLIYIISNLLLIILFFFITQFYNDKIQDSYICLNICFIILLGIVNFFFIWKKPNAL